MKKKISTRQARRPRGAIKTGLKAGFFESWPVKWKPPVIDEGAPSNV